MTAETEEGDPPAAPATADLLASVADGSTDMIAVFDAEFRYVLVNAALEQFLGTPREKLLGRVAWDVFPHSYDTEVGGHYRRAMAERTVAEFETYYPPRDGWFSARCIPLPGGGLAVYSHETTRQRKDEQAREDALRASRHREGHYRQIATTLQTVLQPEARAYSQPGLVAVPVSEPLLTDEADVGGDWHDCIPLTGGRVGLVLGDCMGHGIGAALSISEVRFALRGFLREDPDPTRALQRLNRFLLEARRLEGRPRDSLVALALAVIDTATGGATVCVAGAEAPLVFRAASETVDAVEGGDLLLGASPDAEYPSAAVQLGPGDVLFLASDGIAEARNAEARDGARDAPSGGVGPEQFGSGGVRCALEGALAGARGRGAGAADEARETRGGGDGEADALRSAGRAVIEEARAFAGGAFRDDVTVLLARRT